MKGEQWRVVRSLAKVRFGLEGALSECAQIGARVLKSWQLRHVIRPLSDTVLLTMVDVCRGQSTWRNSLFDIYSMR